RPADRVASAAGTAGDSEAGARGAGRHAAGGVDTGLVPAAVAVAGALGDRYAWAVASVPQLEEHADAVAALAERTRYLAEVPDRQRVHGDLHLGQVLRGDGTWFVLDFEGEPLVPVAQRTRPDLALRDAAGMLRSFDYAAAVGGAPAAWTEVARTAFLQGYSAETPDLDPGARAHLLRVLELDKALYEAVYEARNRPSWLPIPLRAVERLVG
ncbi:aminoglycoside phosphotransferase, partial [Cellulomonas triticagri]